MRPSVRAVHELVYAIRPHDDLEAEHRRDVLHWLAATDDVFRRVKPATPPRHLVAYVVPVDDRDGSCLLGAHRNAGLWLPPGGHVEPDEHPVATARREAAEELAEARWWTPAEVRAEPADRFDPHLLRFLTKTATSSARPPSDL